MPSYLKITRIGHSRYEFTRNGPELARHAGLAFSEREQASMLPIPKRVFLSVAVLLGLAGTLSYADVQRERTLICSNVAAAPARPVAIVFGASGAILADRVTTGVELYKAGKVQKLLMTGDNSRSNYNEPAEMKREALAEGVPSADIVCDDAGFRTYDSLYRAKAIFGVHSALLVTQRYHLPRALFIARSLGMDVVGVDAAKRTYSGQWKFDFREIAAVEVAWVQSKITRPRPKFLGKPEPMFASK